MVVALVASSAAACTFDGLDQYASGDAGQVADAAPDATSLVPDARADVTPPDAGPDAPAPPCNLAAPFGTPQAVTSLNGPGLDMQAVLSPDQLTVYFVRKTPVTTTGKVMTATRATVGDPFGPVTEVTSLDDPDADTWNVALTGDGLTAYYVVGNGMWKAKRTSVLGAFSGAAPMPPPVFSGDQPYVLPDGSALYFTVVPDGGVNFIVRAQLGGSITTATQALSVGAHSAGVPVVSPDELTIYFAVYDDKTNNPYDIYVARRASASSGWGAPTAVPELDIAGFNTPSWISGDGCTIYFTSASLPSSLDWDIYTARRPP